MSNVTILDLNFLGLEDTIAVFVIPHQSGAVLVDCGPGSTIPTLEAGLRASGIEPAEVSDVLLTHIHLDHGGSAGWLASLGARIHVHPLGALHLENPDKLLKSAERIYGDRMAELWGDFLPVPEDKIVTHADGDTFQIGNLSIKTFESLGHAFHHVVYICQDICFSGDAGGIRLPNSRHIQLPTPPPDFHLELWRDSIRKMILEYNLGSFHKIAVTHFGIFEDAGLHLQTLARLLDELDEWIDQNFSKDLSIDELHDLLLTETREKARQAGFSTDEIHAMEAANPSLMSAQGIHRYWNKIRLPGRTNLLPAMR